MAARVVEIAFLGSTAQLEAALTRAGLVAKTSGDAIGDSFDKGSTKAGNAVERLGQKLSGFGVPFAGSLENVGKKFEEADTKGAKFGQTMSALGGVTLLAAGAAFAGVSAEAVKLGISFDRSVAQIAGGADITVAQAKKIGNAFLDTAGKSVYSGNEMAAAFAPVAGQLKLTQGSALDAAQSLTFMHAAADLAEGSQTNLGSTTAALAAVMQSFGIGVHGAAGAADILYNTSVAVGAPISTLVTTVDKLHARLGELTPSLSDVSTLMAELAEHGMTGSRGALMASSAIGKLLSGTVPVNTVLSELGVNLYNSQGKFIGLQAAIAALQPKIAALNEQSQQYALQTLFGAGASNVLGQVIQGGLPVWDKTAAAVNKTGAAHRAAEIQAHTLGGEVKILEATLTDLGTKLGMVLIPALQSMGQWLANGVNWMMQHKAAAEALAAVIGSVLGAAVLVFAEQKAVKFGKSVQGMVQDLQKLGSWITGNLPDMNAKLDTLGGGMSKGVTEGTAESETALQDAKVPLAAAATTDGEAVAAGMNTGGDLGMGVAVGDAEAKLAAAKAPIAEQAAIDGTAAGGAFEAALATAATVGLAAAIGYALGKVANDVLGTNSQSPYNTKGSTAQQILAGDTTLVHGEALYHSTQGGKVASVYSDLFGLGESPAQIKQTIQALQATGQFKGGAYTGYPATSAQAGNPLGSFTGGLTSNNALPGNFSTGSLQISAQQTQFLAALAKGTGLNPQVLAAWLRNEEPSEGQQNPAQGLYNFLNVGITGSSQSQWYGTQNPQWSNPTTAGAATAAWLKGQWNDPGFGNASSGIQAIQNAAGASPAQQIAAIQASGWAGGGETALQSLYAMEQGGSKSAIPYGAPTAGAEYTGGTKPAGLGGSIGGKSLANPTVAAADQKTVDAINTAIKAAADKYAAAAASATSPQLKQIDETFKAKLDALKASFDKQAVGLSGTALEALKTNTSQMLTALVQQATAQLKVESTFEAIRSELTKQEDKYKSAAASATTPLIAEINTGFAKMVAGLESGFHSTSQDVTTKQQLAIMEADAKARLKIAGVAGQYSQAALTATNPLLAQLDEHYAKLLGELATGNYDRKKVAKETQEHTGTLVKGVMAHAASVSTGSLQVSPQQQQFLAAMAKATGLNPQVLAAWLRNEEPSESQQINPKQGKYNFLNVGITGPNQSQWYGAGNKAWENPGTAGTETGQWLKGQSNDDGYGKATAKVQAIAKTAGQSAASQIAAIQASGWASGGETALQSLLALEQETGTNVKGLMAHVSSGGGSGGQMSFSGLPPAGLVARIEQQAKTATTLGGRAVTAIGAGESALSSSSYQTLETATNKIHKQALDQLRKELNATHVSELEKLGKNLEGIFHAEEVAKNDIFHADQQQLNATLLAKETTDLQDTSNKMVQAIKDMTQSITDSFSAVATAITDATQIATDQASGQSTAISDQAQTTVDTLGERGLYGLNLIAQQMQVAADQQKTGLDAQISAAQVAVDTAQQSGDNAQAAQTAIVDAVTAQQNSLIATAQSHLDTVTAQQNILVQNAQAAVNEGKAGAQAALAAAQGTAASTEAAAQQALTQAQDAANAAEAQAQSALANANGQASVVVAQAQQALAQAQNQAQVAEAQSAAQIAIEKEMAATQFAGSGTNIYITGINPSDAAAVASEVSWVARSQFTSPVA